MLGTETCRSGNTFRCAAFFVLLFPALHKHNRYAQRPPNTKPTRKRALRIASSLCAMLIGNTFQIHDMKILKSLFIFFFIHSIHSNSVFGQEKISVDTLQVSVDNHKMSMYTSGTGKYTVILEAGGSSNHGCWRDIDTVIAKTTRVISYDRPGYLK